MPQLLYIDVPRGALRGARHTHTHASQRGDQPGRRRVDLIMLPPQNVMSVGQGASVVSGASRRNADVDIRRLSRDRVSDLAPLKMDAFGSKACCLCLTESPAGMQRSTAKNYAQYPDEKLALCGIAVRKSDNQVLGFCQLAIAGMIGDADLPESLRHVCKPGEAYVEQIAVSQAARGMGLGTLLLDWSDAEAKARGKTFITLNVLGDNTGAIR